MSRLDNYSLNVVSFAPSFSTILAVCVDPINVTGSICLGWFVLEKLDGYKLARTLRSEPSVIPAVFAHTDATTVRAVVVVVVSSITPPMLCVPLVSKMVAVLAAPSAEHCVGQFDLGALCTSLSRVPGTAQQ